MSRPKPRQIAIEILDRSPTDEDFLAERLEPALASPGWSPADRRLVQELVYGVVRWQMTLDWLIERKMTVRPRTLRPIWLLRLGLYQMFWLDRIPDHAAVHETVELAKQSGLRFQAGFLNAVLRNYAREREATVALLHDLQRREPSLGYSHPRWLCERWRQRWGDEPLVQLLRWNNTPAPVYARLNTLKTEAAELESVWHKEGVQWTPRTWDWIGETRVYHLDSPASLASLPSYQQGYFYLQDPSTLLAVQALDPQPDDSILDCCASPGGKTTLMAQCLQNRGRLVAVEPDPKRLDRLRQNCQRLGATGVTILQSTELDRGTSASRCFDKVLVDVPCSNTGVMRRRVELRWRLNPQAIEHLARTQSALLEQAAGRVHPGGTVVYSTCSLEPEENTDIVKAFLKQHPEFQLESERQLLPFVDEVDGAYVAKLRRTRNVIT